MDFLKLHLLPNWLINHKDIVTAVLLTTVMHGFLWVPFLEKKPDRALSTLGSKNTLSEPNRLGILLQPPVQAPVPPPVPPPVKAPVPPTVKPPVPAEKLKLANPPKPKKKPITQGLPKKTIQPLADKLPQADAKPAVVPAPSPQPNVNATPTFEQPPSLPQPQSPPNQLDPQFNPPEPNEQERLTFWLSNADWDFTNYMAHWERRLQKWWRVPQDYISGGYPKGGSVWVETRFSKEGDLLDFKQYRSDVSSEMELRAIQALISSFRLPPLPADFPDEDLVVRWRFVYLPYKLELER